MKKVRFLFCIVFCLIVFPFSVKAEEITLSQQENKEILKQQLHSLPLEEVDRQVEEIWKAEEVPSFGEMVEKVTTEGTALSISEIFS